jgi:hypothetical protein
MKTRLLNRSMVIMLAALLVLPAGYGASPSAIPARAVAETATNAVIDTDMSADDVMAILYLLQRPDVAVRAITVAGTGLAHCDAGTQHARDLVALLAAGSIPVACGRETPLQGTHHFPPDWRVAADQLHGRGQRGRRRPDGGRAIEIHARVGARLGRAGVARPADQLGRRAAG